MDAYLDDSDQSGQYHKLIRQIERFRDVGRVMVQVEANFPDDAIDMLRLLFAAIRAGRPHGKIRELRRMFLRDRDRYGQLVAEVDTIEQAWEADGNSEELADPIDITPEQPELDEEEGESAEPPGPNVPNYPKQVVTDAIENALDGFQAAQTDDVIKTLRQYRERPDSR